MCPQKWLRERHMFWRLLKIISMLSAGAMRIYQLKISNTRFYLQNLDLEKQYSGTSALFILIYIYNLSIFWINCRMQLRRCWHLMSLRVISDSSFKICSLHNCNSRRYHLPFNIFYLKMKSSLRICSTSFSSISTLVCKIMPILSFFSMLSWMTSLYTLNGPLKETLCDILFNSPIWKFWNTKIAP